MNFVYPYHQAIGFYLDQAGVSKPSELKLFLEPGLKFDFYLDYKMEDLEYSEKWRLYYPADM